ncbi:MAG: KH domain-containing protein [Candidatus Dormibacteria bacterium]
MPRDEPGPDYQGLVLFIVQQMVSRPEAVNVEARREGHRVGLRIQTAPEDLGKLIGKQGRHIEALRMVVRAASLRPRDRVTVEVEE